MMAQPPAKKRSARKAPAAQVPWWQPTLTNGNADWREYLLWQVGMLVTALSLLYVILLSRGLPVDDPAVLDRAVLFTLAIDIAACFILGYLINRNWSRSKRFALGFLVLADIFTKLLFLSAANPGVEMFESWWYLLLVSGTGLYLLGTGVIGLIVWRRGDGVSPWWK